MGPYRRPEQAEIYGEISRDDVTAAIVELIHTPIIRRTIPGTAADRTSRAASGGRSPPITLPGWE